MTIADRIRLARQASEHTQMSLAVALGVGLQTVCRWETDRATPCAESLTPLAAALHIPVQWLLSGAGDTDDPTLRRLAEVLGVTVSELIEETE